MHHIFNFLTSKSDYLLEPDPKDVSLSQKARSTASSKPITLSSTLDNLK